MGTRYAAGTSVPMDRSRAEVERTLMRYGAAGFHYAWDRREQPTPPAVHRSWCMKKGAGCACGAPETITREVVVVGFRMKTEHGDRRVQLEVPMPHELEAGSKAKADAATRQRWRALVELLFDRAAGYSVAIWPDGRIRLDGALPLDARGEEGLRKRRGNPTRHPGGPCAIPVSLAAFVAARKRNRA